VLILAIKISVTRHGAMMNERAGSGGSWSENVLTNDSFQVASVVKVEVMRTM
jgi:hypothetical protein